MTFRDLPQDIRPIGTNNLNQLVSANLGSESFDKVAQVQANLPWLHELYKNLPVISRLAGYGNTLQEIAKQTDVLYGIAYSLPALKELYDNLNLLVQMRDKFDDVMKSQQDILNQLNEVMQLLDNNDLAELIANYKEVTEAGNLKDIAMRVKVIEENNSKLSILSYHLNATDMVTLAESTKDKDDIATAKKAIEASVKLGNDESVNLDRVGKIQ